MTPSPPDKLISSMSRCSKAGFATSDLKNSPDTNININFERGESGRDHPKKV